MPQIEETLVNVESECVVDMWGMDALVMLKTPVRFVPIIFEKYSSDISAVGSTVGFIPAQLKTWFIWLNFSTIWVMKSLQAEEELMSNAEVMWCWVFGDGRVQRESVSRSPALLMSVRQRVAPSWESAMAVPRPMPLAAPVMRIILFWKGIDILRG